MLHQATPSLAAQLIAAAAADHTAGEGACDWSPPVLRGHCPAWARPAAPGGSGAASASVCLSLRLSIVVSGNSSTEIGLKGTRLHGCCREGQEMETVRKSLFLSRGVTGSGF